MRFFLSQLLTFFKKRSIIIEIAVLCKLFYGADESMKNESVAILDIRSNEVSFLLGAKGVNGTFVFNGSRTQKYDGFSVRNGFYDEDSFRRAISSAITSVRQNYEGTLTELFVGVPSAFVSVLTKGQTNSYPSKRKLVLQDVEALYESGLNELLAQGRCIRRSDMYFTLGDNRKYFSTEDLYGVPTTLLKGALCYYFVQEDFYDTVRLAANHSGFTDVRFIPSTLAQAKYLFPQEKREGYAFLLDVGFLTSSISVIYGNGIVHEESFDCGVGQVLALLVKKLGVDYATAEEILAASNVSGGFVADNLKWSSDFGETTFPVRKINEVIKCGLDELCERVENFFAKYYRDRSSSELMVNPIGVTGEGIGYIKGMAEHISGRLNRLTEIVYPDLPYYDKPMFSSRIALLDTALSDRRTQSWFQKLFHLGGKRK